LFEGGGDFLLVGLEEFRVYYVEWLDEVEVLDLISSFCVLDIFFLGYVYFYFFLIIYYFYFYFYFFINYYCCFFYAYAYCYDGGFI
jgi:hypothetical protein